MLFGLLISSGDLNEFIVGPLWLLHYVHDMRYIRTMFKLVLHYKDRPSTLLGCDTSVSRNGQVISYDHWPWVMQVSTVSVTEYKVDTSLVHPSSYQLLARVPTCYVTRSHRYFQVHITCQTPDLVELSIEVS